MCLWRLASPKSAGWLEPQEEWVLQLKSEGHLEAELLPPQGTSVCFLLWPSTD